MCIRLERYERFKEEFIKHFKQINYLRLIKLPLLHLRSLKEQSKVLNELFVINNLLI